MDHFKGRRPSDPKVYTTLAAGAAETRARLGWTDVADILSKIYRELTVGARDGL